MDTALADTLEDEESMFVQTASGLTSGAGTITLTGVTASTLYFSDRPDRVVGHLATVDFVDLWAVGDNSFETDPPNAVLSFLPTGETAPKEVVVVLKDPQLDGDRLSYAVEVLEGQLPAETAPVTLFIDPFGRPLSPVSVCGVRRRQGRRMRRRF